MTKYSTVAKLVCAAALAGASMTAVADSEQDLGLLTPGILGHPFGGNTAVGPFTDVFKFELPANGGTGYSVLDFPTSVTIPNVGTFTFKNVFSSMLLVSNPDGILYNGDDTTLKSTLVTNASSMALTWGPTTGGKMYLIVNGIGQGTAGGFYNGSITVSPVPEAETWAMMLVGAGLIGFRLRNRSKKAAAHRFV